MKNHKRGFGILPIIIVLAILAAGGYLVYKTKTSGPATPVSTNGESGFTTLPAPVANSILCMDVKVGQERNQCYDKELRSNLSNRDIGLCPDFPIGDYRDRCYLGVLRNENGGLNFDINTCTKMTKSDFRATCYGVFASVKEDLSICENLPQSEKDNCFYTVARDAWQKPKGGLDHQALCNKIEEASVRETCYQY